MGAFPRIAGFLITVLAALSSAVGQSVRCELSRQLIFVGQETTYQILVRGAKEAELEAPPEVSGLTFETPEEGVANTGHSITIINGRRTETETGDYVFRWKVEALKPGSYTLPPPRVKVQGRSLIGNAITLTVQAASSQDLAFIELSVEQDRLVRGEMARITVDVFMKHLPPGLSSKDPFSPYDQGRGLFDAGTPPPMLTLPWIPAPPVGLGGFDLDKWARPLIAQRTGGLRLDRIQQNLRFAGDKVDVEREDASGAKAKYRRSRFVGEFQAEAVGRYDLGPARIEGSCVHMRGAALAWREVFATTESVVLTVEEPPAEGRPAAFTGAIGRFQLEVAPPTPTDVMVGDAIYLTVVVSGEGYLVGVDIDFEKQLGSDFRVERPKVTDSLPPGADRPAGFPNRPGKWRQFDVKVRPTREGVKEIPSLSFAYFETKRRAYETSSSLPHPITVRASAAAPGDSGVVLGTKGGSERREAMELVPIALSANVDDLNLLGNDLHSPWWPLAALLAAIPLYLGVAFFVRNRRALDRDPALRRRLSARSNALKRLADAKRVATSDPRAAASDGLRALLGFVADQKARPLEATTSGDLLDWARNEVHLEKEALAAVESLASIAEEASFGGAPRSSADLGNLLSAVERVLGVSSGRKHSAKLLLACLLIQAGEVVAQDKDVFTKSEAAFQSGRYAEAEELLRSQVRDDYENAWVLYNLGNACLKQGKIGHAIASYRRALLHRPGDANIQNNLDQALAARKQNFETGTSRAAIDYALFWRGALALRQQISILLGAGLAALALAFVGLWIDRRLPILRWTIGALLVVAILFGISAILDYREQSSRNHGVMTKDGIVLRQWPSPDAERTYEQSIDQGVEFRITDRRSGWLKARLADKYEGWIESDFAATW